jgi:hypothetical protein
MDYLLQPWHLVLVAVIAFFGVRHHRTLGPISMEEMKALPG